MAALDNMLVAVKEEYLSGAYETMEECLNDYIRKNKYWPMLQLKKISKDLMLLHNTYIRNDVSHFKDLYECARSVVLDMNDLTVVVSLADKIPSIMSVEEYGKVMQDGDLFEKAYEGTMVYAYNYKDTWHFGTSTCASIDNSRYFHPTKTHGQMFDEALRVYFPEAENVREEFCKSLYPQEAYGFLLVHYENANTMNYSQEFGREDYAVLFHILTKEKTKGFVPKDMHKLSELGIMYTKQITINRTDEAVAIRSVPEYETDFTYPIKFIEMVEDPNTYGVIVRSGDKTYRVSRKNVIKKEDTNRGNYNPWVNMLSVYMLCRPDYTIEKYIDEYIPSEKQNLIFKDMNGNTYNPTVIIHDVMRTMCDMLYNAYRETTYYNKLTHRYIMNREIDYSMAPIIRFHLAQLRNVQITTHTHAPLNYKAVRQYLCINQPIKNVRLLIAYFATLTHSSTRTATCFIMLNSFLSI